MKFVLPVILLLIFIIPGHSYAQVAEKLVFYVSLSGNDGWSGKLAAPGKNKTDGPFKTFERVKLEIEQLNEKGSMPAQGIEIIIRGGAYLIEETIMLTNKHAGKVNAPVVWKHYGDEKVQLVGGKAIEGFHTLSDPAARKSIPAAYQKNILEVNLKAHGITDFGTITNRGKPGLELFFNNKKMQLARWPNEGWAKIADVPQRGELVYQGDLPHMRFGIPVGKHYGRFTYNGNRQNNWSNTGDVFLHGYWVWDWYDEFVQVQSIDTATKEIFIQPPHSHYGYSKEQRYYAVNVLEELDLPGEWYLDRSNGLLFFWPPSSIATGKTFVSLLDNPVMLLDNTENVRVEGLSFQFSRGNGIVIRGGRNNLIGGCTFSNLGDVAVKLEGGENNGIAACNIYDVAAGGAILNGGDRKSLTPGGNFVVNSHIHHFSQWIRTYQSAITISGVGNRAAHNVIHDAPGSGILLTGNEHIIEYNELHDLALETGDVGAFYMGRDWTERGNIIRYNYFHDLTGPGVHDVNAVYLDDWASGTTVSGNIFYNCARGIMIGGGRNNMVDNNIFIGCKPAVHVDSRGLGWAKYYFNGTTNTLFERMDAMHYKLPPYAEKYPALLLLYDDEPAVAKYNTLTHNISYLGRWIDLHDGLNLNTVLSKDNIIAKPEKEFINAGDHIINENPGIGNYSNGDFVLQQKALRYGFKAIPYHKIGLQKDKYRKNPLKTFNTK
ncbi:right-handed parallel beta-helix repeat-containing protein [Agriterribacter sp.]|uniref:right-handed parallel beta-helix repeat-containing protein n=1 Tax=Agriterribacter sp. TaxID=2821509 RepID=UPI002CD91C25|nr:right-handed parallel beta-helix repeat-containing protein [Agriterribacter sp.]HRO48090.1 right-handed parallel beta-helix repeat-containing protein [Agriterribacter sp.]HRQ19202.1 right-handed parallel beta-helix repeat-containing protein [Agriterribacter sp.]